MNFREQAQDFLENEKQFHLGDLITEQSHPKTRNLSSDIERDISEGVASLLEVDMDIIPVAERTFASLEYDRLVDSVYSCVKRGKTVCFSSCGASGRLAIILEAMWRDLSNSLSRENPENEKFPQIENQVYSIMTGGDRALIRSVENFEDYQEFGRRQFRESGLGQGDLLIALTEGGEISSVIGTMKEALDNKTGVCMLFNNPPDLLTEKFERSREVLTNSRILKINLTTGPMALAGSTRMQATTIAMLIMGAAIEEVFSRILSDENAHDLKKANFSRREDRKLFSSLFETLLMQLKKRVSIDSICRVIEAESACYMNSGRISYVTDKYLLDIFSDTTERSPTFMIPPFRQHDDTRGPVPWAFAIDPHRDPKNAWINLLKREPRGLDWKMEDYIEMKAPESIRKRINLLSREEIYKYHFGSRPDESRYECKDSLILAVSLNEDELSFQSWWEENSVRFRKSLILSLGKKPNSIGGLEPIHIPLDFYRTKTNLFEHLALKLIFNIISTATMAKIGRIRGNWMIQLDATNKKLTDRATRIIAHFAGISYEDACVELFRTMENPETERLEFEKSYILQTLGRLGISI